MLFYLAQSSSLIILQKIQYHKKKKKNAQFLPQLTHVAECDWWEKKVVGPCESNKQPNKV